MMNPKTFARLMLGGAMAAESALALRRFEVRRRTYQAAVQRAAEIGRPLIVVGDPDAGTHTRLIRAYGCGDLCIDLKGCPRCQVMKAADLTQGPIEGIADDSAVVYISCVLEYVSDPESALQELGRMAGTPDNLFIVFVEPWSLTAALYPGARWSGDADQQHVTMEPITTQRKAATLAGLAGLLALALWPRRQ